MALSRLTVPDSASIVRDGKASTEHIAWMNDVVRENEKIKELLDGTIVDTLNWEMIYVENDTFSLLLKAPWDFEVTETTSKSSTGTCTATFKINGVALGGSANSVSTSEQSQAHTSANTGVAGDDLTVSLSANSSCEHAMLSVKFNRTLIV